MLKSLVFLALKGHLLPGVGKNVTGDNISITHHLLFTYVPDNFY